MWMKAGVTVASVAVVVQIQGAQGLESFGFYQPSFDVSEHAEIDLDVEAMSNLASNGSFAAAEDIYLNGKFSSKGGDSLRNLAGFSTELRQKKDTFEASLNLLQEFDLFATYYGSDEYAHKFVSEALAGTGHAQGLDEIVRWQLAVKGAQYQSVWMYVLYELAKALNLCSKGEDGRVNWDEGAAFYVGSLIGSDGSNGDQGQLLYTLAEKRCQSFGTCDGSAGQEPTANANVEAIKAFNAGLKAIGDKDCSEANKQYNIIRKQMQIPLIQGMLLYAFKSDKTNNGKPKDMAEAWAFTAGVLPFLSQVDKSEGDKIRANMELKSGVTQTVQDGYQAVFTSTYKLLPALCISCEELGVNDFNLGEAPTCTTDADAYKSGCDESLLPVLDENEVNVGLVVGLSVAGFVIIAALIGAMCYISKADAKTSEKKQVLAEDEQDKGASFRAEEGSAVHQV